ncbi:MAG TPA: PilZ domain-containing protein [Candidatus Acidoferrum sp.]|jgi:hypothetical protein
MDRREHRRVQLHLPVRLRWSTPIGQKTETCETLDVSRSGLLVPSREAHAAGVALWVTFPYDAEVRDGQPEISARVARSSNGNRERVVGLQFEVASDASAESNGHSGEKERRSNPRRRVALPIRVRPDYIPWFEEAMTIDVSADGLRFLSSREYEAGQHLLFCFVAAAPVAWMAETECRSLVVRVNAVRGSSNLEVSVCRLE